MAVDAIWGMVTVAIILGGILSGVFTPTESGAVACIYAFLVTMFVYRDVKWREVPKLIARVVRTVGLVMPPVGPTMVVGCAIGRVSMEAVSRSILIFYVPMLIVLALVTYVPALSLWLPSVLLK